MIHGSRDIRLFNSKQRKIDTQGRSSGSKYPTRIARTKKWDVHGLKKASSWETDTRIVASNEVAIKLIAADLIQGHFSRPKVVSTEQRRGDAIYIQRVAAARSSLPKFHDFFLSCTRSRVRRVQEGEIERERERDSARGDTFRRQSRRWNNEPTNRRGPCKSPGLAPPLSPPCRHPPLDPWRRKGASRI